MPDNSNPIEHRKGHFLSLMILSLVALGLIFSAASTALWLVAANSQAAFYALGYLAATIFLLALLVVNRYGYTRLSGYLSLFTMLAAICLSFPPSDHEQTLALFTIPTLAASFILSPPSSILWGGLSMAAYTGLHIIGGDGEPFNLAFVATILITALMAWLIAAQLERSLRASMQQSRELTANNRALITQRTQIQQQYNNLQALYTIDQAVTSPGGVQDVLSILLSQVTIQLKVHASVILLYKPETDSLVLIQNRGLSQEVLSPEQAATLQSIGSLVVGMGCRITARDVLDRDPAFDWSPLNSISAQLDFHAVPLAVREGLKGVLIVFTNAPFDPDQEWLLFLDALATHAAIALDNLEMVDQLQRSNQELTAAYDGTLLGWSRALELRDHETQGHSLRVAQLTVEMARELGVLPALLPDIRRGALLHDIGKMGIPDTVLLKPGPLSESEWETMRRHPVFAYELLSLTTYLEAALEIPYCHHEKWDGSGYPRGLRAEEIPLSARIFAVVDVWDSLTHARPYHLAWTRGKTIDYIIKESGSHFDPSVVDAFLRVIRLYG